MITKFGAVLVATLAGSYASADDVRVDTPWARATAPGQPVAGAFMDLTASEDLSLVGASSPASKTVELHTMSMDNGVMSMRQLKRIDLPKGKTVSLKPGGRHIMLIDLNAPLKAPGSTRITLTVQDKRGKRHDIAFEMPILDRAPAAPVGPK
jgi:copper(I)-binding protein